MISGKMAKAFNKQLNAELYSSYLYLSMAADFESKSLLGFSNWLRAQAEEELLHSMKFYEFLVQRGGKVELLGIDAPPVSWKAPIDAFHDAYNHEVKVTGMINDLVNLATEEKDHAANAFLQWFVTEQVEEEASADAVVQKLKLMGEAQGGLFMLDRELALRVKLFALPITGPVAGGAAN